jgi:hypothetical protein
MPGVPAWALGKCVEAETDAEVTIPQEGRAAQSGPTADQQADADRAAAAEAAAKSDAEQAELDAKVAAAKHDELITEAAALGVRVQAKWDDKRLAAEVAKAKAAQAAEVGS